MSDVPVSLLDRKATLAMRAEDLRIARKHAEEAGARVMSPENRRAYLRCLDWQAVCLKREQQARGLVILAGMAERARVQS
jgi:hypothetical protein